MKMYVWKTHEWGFHHFAVLANSKEESMQMIDNKIKSSSNIRAPKWRTDVYHLTILKLGEVASFFYK